MKKAIGFILAILCFHLGYGQLSGTNPVTPGQAFTYTFNDVVVYSTYAFYLSNGDGIVSNQNRSGTTYTCTVTWISAGTSTLTFSAYGTTKGTYNVTINCPTLVTPTANFSYPSGTTVCGAVPVTYTTNPPAGVTWYWQTASNGTSTSNSSKSYSASTSGTYSVYLRGNCLSNWNTTAQSTSSLTVKPIPIVSGSPKSICSGTATGLVLSNTIASTTDTWTVSQSNVTGASNSSGVSGSSSPFNYTIAQTLTASIAAGGTATYTIAPSVNGCTGAALPIVVTVKATPNAAATSQSIFSGQTTSISITNPNGVSGTTFSWTASASSVTGASNGSGNLIAQTLTNNTTGNGTATYTITPTAAGCSGATVAPVATVYPDPTITAPQTYVAKSASVLLDVGAGYSTYSWTNNVGAPTGSAQTYSANVAGSYTVTITKPGASTNKTIILSSQFSGLNMNYIVTNTVLKSGKTNPVLLDNLPVDTVNQTVAYFDGLGRPLQTVVTQGSPLRNDLITPAIYDAFGRENRKYLPVSIENTGRYKSALLDGSGNYTGTNLNYNNGSGDKVVDDTRAFSETIFETTPLSRPLVDYGPGLSWYSASKSVAHAYPLNLNGTASGTEQIIAWVVDPNTNLPVKAPTNGTSITNGYYNSGTLNIKSTKDEQGHEVREYTDMAGHTVLKKVQLTDSAVINDPTGWALTYYIYDDIGRLLVVLPPEAYSIFTN